MKIDRSDPVTNQIVGKFIRILKRNNFRIVCQQYEPKHFGDLFIDLCSSTICCRLVRDRGQWFIDIKSVSSTDWFYIGVLYTFICGITISINTLWPIDEQLKFLTTYINVIDDLFSSKTVRSTEEQLRKIREIRGYS